MARTGRSVDQARAARRLPRQRGTAADDSDRSLVTRRGWGRAACLGVALLLLPPSEAGACSMRAFPYLRDPGLTHLIATPRSDTLRRSGQPLPAPVRAQQRQFAMPGETLDGEYELAGQLARIERVGGRGAALIRANGDGQVLLVPWAYRPNCVAAPWSESARWLRVPDPGFFTAVLRPESEWIDGIPTLDVLAAWMQPYPYGRFLRHERGSSLSEPWLSLAEYWNLYEALPVLRAGSGDRVSRQEIERLRRWERANPHLTVRFPAREVLPLAYRLAGAEPSSSNHPD